MNFLKMIIKSMLPVGYMKKNNKDKMINLYYNYFYSLESEERRGEIDYCFSKLLDNKFIDKCYVLIVKEDMKNFKFKNKKIVTIEFKNEKNKPYYQDYFDLAKKYSKDDDINIILNTDCFIDENDTIKLYDMTKKIFFANLDLIL
jgi:hypothetical protein